MEDKNKIEEFNYTYSAREYDEVEAIRKNYLPKTEDKIGQLKKIDAKVTSVARTVAIVVGIIGTLVMGGGMACCLELGGSYMLVGIILGLVGITILSCAYPVYSLALKMGRRKAAPTVLKLADEIVGER